MYAVHPIESKCTEHQSRHLQACKCSAICSNPERYKATKCADEAATHHERTEVMGARHAQVKNTARPLTDLSSAAVLCNERFEQRGEHTGGERK